jgi:hypothetical protein
MWQRDDLWLTVTQHGPGNDRNKESVSQEEDRLVEVK